MKERSLGTAVGCYIIELSEKSNLKFSWGYHFLSETGILPVNEMNFGEGWKIGKEEEGKLKELVCEQHKYIGKLYTSFLVMNEWIP